MAVNIFKKAKAYRKIHPNVSFQDAIQKVSGKSAKPVSGVKKKRKVSGVKSAVGVRRKAVKRAVSGVVAKRRIGKAVNTKVDRLQGHVIEINRLEGLRKRAKTADVKNAYQRLINAQHDKIDAIGKRKRA